MRLAVGQNDFLHLVHERHNVGDGEADLHEAVGLQHNVEAAL